MAKIKNKKNSGQKLWLKGKKYILGGNMLLSKRPNLFLPDLWPTYFSKTKSCFIWDLDNKKYIDMSYMGVGTNILGYNNNRVDREVERAIKKGNISTFNAPEEVELARKLISMHKWAYKAKFARTGGEIASVAIRIARNYSKKNKVAICGYHGWHDWYLSANINKKSSLKNHLFDQLNIGGVPKEFGKLTFSFEYNDFDSLLKVYKKNPDIGVIIMEVKRNFNPKKNFLKKIKNFCTKNKIVLIFDECTSGFRENFGGLHLKYKIIPDIVLFGKALGNGYAITALLGNKKVMKEANDLFISSTFWTERIGSVAGLATLKEMKRIKSWKKITKIGKIIKEKWKRIFDKYLIEYEIKGLDSIVSFEFKRKNFNVYKTFITQEMLKKGILANNSIYVSIDHDNKILKKYFVEFEKVIKKIQILEQKGIKLEKLLESKASSLGFKRLN